VYEDLRSGCDVGGCTGKGVVIKIMIEPDGEGHIFIWPVLCCESCRVDAWFIHYNYERIKMRKSEFYRGLITGDMWTEQNYPSPDG